MRKLAGAQPNRSNYDELTMAELKCAYVMRSFPDKGYAAIATEMQLSPSTVRSRMAVIYHKLGINTREAFLTAFTTYLKEG